MGDGSRESGEGVLWWERRSVATVVEVGSRDVPSLPQVPLPIPGLRSAQQIEQGFAVARQFGLADAGDRG